MPNAQPVVCGRPRCHLGYFRAQAPNVLLSTQRPPTHFQGRVQPGDPPPPFADWRHHPGRRAGQLRERHRSAEATRAVAAIAAHRRWTMRCYADMLSAFGTNRTPGLLAATDFIFSRRSPVIRLVNTYRPPKRSQGRLKSAFL